MLDQFEEYFLYHRAERGPGSLDEELSVALRRRSTPANFVLSIREDALAQLDRFEDRVPGLLANLLRIDHLDRAAAREAIERPLEHWNRVLARPGEEAAIEPALVEAVLDQVEAGKLRVDEAGIGAAPADGAGELRVEAPYLQLVLTRLWAEERSLGSRVLRLESLERLGGAERIVRTHLDATMGGLPRTDQDVAARAFRYLVTPSGTKIAQRVDDLAELSDVPRERLEPVLEELSGEARILRPAADGAYEVYHDALVGPILHWRAVWQERQRRRRERRRLALSASGAVVLALVAAAFLALFVAAREARDDARSRELAARAGAVLGSDPQESLRLALSGVSSAPTAQAVSALRAALAEANVDAVLRGHRGPVTGAAFSPDATRVVTSSDDGTAAVWDARSGRRLRVLRGHEGRVLSAAFSPDGRLILTAGADGTARLWDAGTGRAVHVFRGHDGRVFTAAFSADGTRIVTAGLDRTARIWNARSGRSVHVLRARRAVRTAVFSADGTRVVTAGDDGKALVWDARSGRTLHALSGHVGPVWSAAFSADGRQIATAGSDGTARVWDGRSGQLVAVLRGHTGSVLQASFSPDGRRVLTAGEDGTARLWDPRTGRSLRVLREHADAVRSAVFSPDGRLVATASDDGTGRIWDVASGQSLHVLRGHGAAVSSVTFSADGARVVTAGDDAIARIWDAHAGDSRLVLRASAGASWALPSAPTAG